MHPRSLRLASFLFLAIVCLWSCENIHPKKAASTAYQAISIASDPCPHIILDSNLYSEGWNQMPQPAFWRRIMRLSLDTTLINLSSNRTVVGSLPTSRWMQMSQKEKSRLEDSIRTAFRVDQNEHVFFTSGKSHFYQFDQVIPDVPRALEVFHSHQTDPWYAQAIMLIESPVGLRFSSAGAYGPFQLMEGVARQFGLVVNDSLDEREVFECSAEAAARLISTTCVPKARAMVSFYGILPDEQSIWFRLLVLHVYHAGAGNVRGVLQKIHPVNGGPELIREVWRTEYRNFGNSSQNYTQIALAAMLEADSLMRSRGDTCQGIKVPGVPYSSVGF